MQAQQPHDTAEQYQQQQQQQQRSIVSFLQATGVYTTLYASGKSSHTYVFRSKRTRLQSSRHQQLT
jgi:hypothetical protein